MFIATALLLAAGAVGAAHAPALAPASPESVGFSPGRLAMLDAYLKAKVASGHAPGATMLIARHGKVVLFNTYGQADRARGTAVERDTIFRIYSQTKLVTGVALMTLFEEGRWRFDDPVTRFIPEFAKLKVYQGRNADGTLALDDAMRPASMREIITHTGGFGYGLGTSDDVEKAYNASGYLAAPSADDAIARIAELPLASQPGLHWRYSASVDIQGYIIERLSGRKLGDFMQERIFGPLRMNDTAFHVPASKAGRFATLESYDRATNSLTEPSGVLVFDYSKPPGAASGGAGLVSTTMDFARFAQMLLNGGELDGARVLSPAAVKLLESNHLASEIRAKNDEAFSEHTGVGFGVDAAVVLDAAKAGTLQGEGTISWGGAAGSWFWIDPKNDLLAVGMLQVMERWSDPALRTIDYDTSALVYRALVDPAK
ncbi:MAG TPA: serine hydrolase domain-containing protein [Steroidobacteraceae bacterium]|nr:serine hydrolase domain-containing protein [Steroidobacteraceae bacterium]